MKLRMRAFAAVAVLSAITAANVACTSQMDSNTTSDLTSPPSFALTSADVVFPDGRDYPINLIFVAKDDDPIWTQLNGVKLSEDVSIGPGQFNVIRGEGTDGYFLGNLTFDLPIPPDGMSFDSVALDYEQSSGLTTVAVGSWELNSAAATDFATNTAHAEVAAMADCTSADLPSPSNVATLESLESGSSHVTVGRAALDADTSSIEMSLQCSGDWDFYVISPSLAYVDFDGVNRNTRFSPISIGLQEIDDADLEKIRER